MEQTELEKVVLLPGTILVEMLEKENTSKTGIIVSTVSKLRKGRVVKVSSFPTERKENKINVQSEDIVLMQEGTNDVVRLDGKKYELMREDRSVLLILERNQIK